MTKTKTGKTSDRRPSNDRPANVRIEIRAAALAAGARSRKTERLGMTLHDVDREDTRDDARDDRPLDTVSQAEVEAGYLCREIQTHESRQAQDEQAQSRDAARPLVAQSLMPPGSAAGPASDHVPGWMHELDEIEHKVQRGAELDPRDDESTDDALLAAIIASPPREPTAAQQSEALDAMASALEPSDEPSSGDP